MSFLFSLIGTKVYKLLFDAGHSMEDGKSNEISEVDDKDDDRDVSTIRYVTGQRGSRKIVCGGFSYICAKINGDRKVTSNK